VRHVAPHRWNELWAGRVPDGEREAMERHAAKCRACARARERVTRASDSFAPIKQQAAPELPWDSIRARIHWSVSKDRRDREQAQARPRRVPRLVWAVGALAGATALAVVLRPSSPPSERAPVIGGALPTIRAPLTAPSPIALAGLVSRASGEILIDGVRAPDLFARQLVAGTVLATGEGNVDVQFGAASAFALGPRSTLELRKFDSETVELAVEGTIDVTVAARGPHQRFLVIAGDRTVEVRGTQFRVTHDSASTTVACRHGLVAVRDPHGEVDVATARRVQVAAGHALRDLRAVPLSVDELAVLAQATPMTLPLWEHDALAHNSAPLEIATVGRRDVRVDGIELGLAPLRVRVLPGRHTVEAADSAGRYRRAGWVDVAADGTPARVEVPAEAPRTSGVTERGRQLRAGIDHDRIAHCMRSISRAGMTGTFVQVELSVDPAGAVGFLNVIDTDLPAVTSRCIRDVLADVRFGSGAAATWRERIDL
jgi:hypothetical protein